MAIQVLWPGPLASFVPSLKLPDWFWHHLYNGIRWRERAFRIRPSSSLEKSSTGNFFPRMHGRGWEGAAPESDAGRSVQRGWPRVGAASAFFFFFFFLDSRLLGSIRVESTSIRAESTSIRAESTSIRAKPGWFGQNRAVSAISVNIGRRPIRPKQAGIGLENHRRDRNSDLKCVSCLILSLFCESSILMCFLRIF